MPIVSVNEFKSLLPSGAKLLGLDISKSSIGIGFADVSSFIVTPVTVISRKRLADDATKVSRLINEYGASGLVVGWPLHMDGSEGKRCQAVKDTVQEMAKHWGAVPIAFQDERLSSAQADKLLEEIGVKSRKIKEKPNDAKAAMVILESFLNDW